MMEWHIVTGSKGGVGKTLLSLFLLTRSFDDPNGCTLVVDLNSMNTDFTRALRRHRNQVNTLRKTLMPNREFDIFQLSGRYALQSYLLMCPINPFLGMNADSFTEFLVTLKKEINDGSFVRNGRFALENPITRVIIDTNYHFCNIFHDQVIDDNYAPYMKGGYLGKDSFSIWFLWVAAQLEALLVNSPESITLMNTAHVIESTLGRLLQILDVQGQPVRTTPFIHVVSPISLLAANPNRDCIATLAGIPLWRQVGQVIKRRAADALQPNEERESFTISSLKDCHPPKMATQNSIGFESLLKALVAARARVPEPCQQDAHEFFTQTIINAIGNQRQANIIPLATIHRKLKSYTDDDTIFDFAKLSAYEVYHELCEMMNNMGDR